MAFTLVAVGLTWARSEPLDSSAFAGTSRDVLDAEPVQELLVEEIADPIVARLPPQAGDQEERIEAAVAGVVTAPEFGDVFEGAVEEVHRALLEDRTDTVVLDLSPAITLVREAVGEIDPRFAAAVDESDLARVPIGDDDEFPDLSRVDDVVGTGIGLSLGAAGLTLALALGVSTRRPRLLGWTALGLGAASLLGLVVLLGLPDLVTDRLVDRGADEQVADALRAVLDALFGTLRVALGGVAAVAASAAAAAFFWPRRARLV